VRWTGKAADGGLLDEWVFGAGADGQLSANKSEAIRRLPTVGSLNWLEVFITWCLKNLTV